MNKQDAIDRLHQIVTAWKAMMSSYPPEIAEHKTTMMVLRGPDIEAMELALEILSRPSDAEK